MDPPFDQNLAILNPLKRTKFLSQANFQTLSPSSVQLEFNLRGFTFSDLRLIKRQPRRWTQFLLASHHLQLFQKKKPSFFNFNLRYIRILHTQMNHTTTPQLTYSTRTNTPNFKGKTTLQQHSTEQTYNHTKSTRDVSRAKHVTRGYPSRTSGSRASGFLVKRREEPRDGRRSTETTLSRILLAHWPSFLSAPLLSAGMHHPQPWSRSYCYRLGFRTRALASSHGRPTNATTHRPRTPVRAGIARGCDSACGSCSMEGLTRSNLLLN